MPSPLLAALLDELGRWEPVLYILAIGLLLLRQAVAWHMGWRLHGRYVARSMEAVRSTKQTKNPHPLWWQAGLCDAHRDPQHDPLSPKFGLVLKPTPVGARKWSYRPRRSRGEFNRPTWTRWMLRCMGLATYRRFQEPEFHDWCVICWGSQNEVEGFFGRYLVD